MLHHGKNEMGGEIVEHMAGFTNLPQPIAPPELLPTVITGWIPPIESFSIKVFAFWRTPFGNVKKTTSVTGTVRAAVGSEVKDCYRIRGMGRPINL